jgi:hypothetical protein
MVQHPLGRARVGFDKFNHLLTHIVEDPNIPPKEYTWEPIVLIEFLALALNGDLHAKSVISHLFDTYNVSLDNYDTSALAETMFYNKDAQYDIRDATESYVWANLLVDFITRDERVPFPISHVNVCVLKNDEETQ